MRPIEKMKENGHEMTKIDSSIGDMLITVSHGAVTTLSCVYHRDQLQSPKLTMVRGSPLSDDLRTVILNMARHLDVPAIWHYTGCPICTICALLSDYRRKGTVLHKELLKQTLRGKKRVLTSEGVRVCAVLEHISCLTVELG